jgi:hypothetical protein
MFVPSSVFNDIDLVVRNMVGNPILNVLLGGDLEDGAMFAFLPCSAV